MKQLFILIIISLSLAVCSCGGNNATKESNTNNAAVSSDAVTSSSTSDASFSCKIDGKDFPGKGNNSYANTAIVSSPGLINFVLVPMDATQKGVPPQFNFFVADKGTTAIPDANNSAHSVTYNSGVGIKI
ncbi:MAG TPA: hypothetical protein VIJ75_01435 [Hanamia sp.]